MMRKEEIYAKNDLVFKMIEKYNPDTIGFQNDIWKSQQS